MAALIGSVDRSLSNNADSLFPEDQPSSFYRDDLPLPRGMLEATLSDSTRSIDASRRSRHRHDTECPASDSGLGSSMSTANDLSPNDSTKPLVHAAITRSHAGRPQQTKQHTLSLQAAKQIERLIINPLLRLKVLKEFHPLVRDLPRRINEKEILCLRDLEKTLVFLAPVSHLESWLRQVAIPDDLLPPRQSRAKSAKSYLNFCVTSIQCVHTTVDHISERDQRRPTDVPYSNGYFLDLVGQIRQYASEVAATRQRQAAGQTPTENDFSPSDSLPVVRRGHILNHARSEKVVLEGGLSQTGRPARLARSKDGKMLPIGIGPSAVDHKSGEVPPSMMKRSMSGASEEDTVHRSMARRRKLAPGEVAAEPIPQVCGQCNKQFARACDLT